MKRLSLLFAFLLLGSAAVYAASVTIDASGLKNGETKTVVDDGKTIKVTRDGDKLQIDVEGGGKTKHVTITNDANGELRINGRDVLGHGRRIVIDGRPLDDFIARPLPPRVLRNQTWFVCPKDHTMLRVPEAKDEQSFKCPLDGTAMEKRKGRGFAFFLDDDALDLGDI